ncbi:acetyl-CoA carboxylase biotin carboxyl carrier protein subunit [Vogesella facilis]|uniref:Acetyl-CoA carboxylase biotin carboxyl carrier protein subunit n=1 Tax=Vogesella facilis TaxID=1655232 RepID=A0ABV7RHL9_9NEIS
MLATAGHDNHAFGALQGWRLNGAQERRVAFSHGEQRYEVLLRHDGDGFVLGSGDDACHARARLLGSRLAANLGGKQLHATLVRHGLQRVLFAGDERLAVDYVDPYAFADAGVHGETHLKAPMPGRVVALLAECGQAIAKGEPLLILEAMKMEHTIAAPADGKVLAFYFAAGEQVSDGDELVDFEAD